MRKHYLHLALVFVLSLFVGQSFAQTAGNIYLGHCKYDDYIYEYDGLSLDHDSKVGVGIKLTRDMFEDYIGGKISAFRCGWDDAASSATYDCFVRVGNFNGETIAHKLVKVHDGKIVISPDMLPAVNSDTTIVASVHYVEEKYNEQTLLTDKLQLTILEEEK